jgi:hypothetical protein
MKCLGLGAAASIALSAALCGGCATQEQGQQQAAERNPCVGVAPATGSLIRRSSDCGGSRASAADDAAKQQIMDEIRNSTPMHRPPGG